jgi:hypothetical protein
MKKYAIENVLPGSFTGPLCETIKNSQTIKVGVGVFVLVSLILGSKKVDDFIRTLKKEPSLASQFKASIWSMAALKCAGWIVLLLLLIWPLVAILAVCGN